MGSRPAAGGGREIAVAAERLGAWLAGFAARHGPVQVDLVAHPGWGAASAPPARGAHPGQVVRHTAPDGALAEVEVPFPPLRGDLLAHVLADRRVGVLLVRRGGHAVGVVEGRRLVVSKVGSRHVQGRTAAGGWSQQRFARRRAGQARSAVEAAAQVAVDVLLPHAAGLAGLVVGGDRAGVAAVLADARLAPLAERVTGRLLDVPDPRLRVLETVPDRLRAVWVRVLDRSADAAAGPDG